MKNKHGFISFVGTAKEVRAYLKGLVDAQKLTA